VAIGNSIDRRLGALTVSLLLTLAGCGSEDGEGGGPSSAATPPSGGLSAWITAASTFELTLSGSVGDGPIAGARIMLRTNSGELLAETTSSSTADYQLTVKTKGRNYPLTIEADQGVDMVTGAPPDFALLSSATRPSNRTVVNLNPFTTLIFTTAQHAGGITDTNVSAARQAVVYRYGFGLDAALVPDPNSTPIDDSNVHLIIKSSETLGEMIRRTRDALYGAGSSRDGDGVVQALAADLVDGYIDGRGAGNHDARLAAVANVASAAVLVQAMANRLHVYGYDATRAMDDAIRVIRPNAPSASNTANVGIPAEAFAQAIFALHTAAVLVDDARITETIAVLQRATPGTLPATVAALLPSGIDAVLDAAIRHAAFADDTQMSAINAIARGEDSPSAIGGSSGSETPPSDNEPPVISGSPDTALVVGTPWSFQPTASDPDGDTLSFSVTNQPAWAQFDSKTGRLWGTPASAGDFGPVTISVSDGQASSSLQAFTLYVSEPTIGNATVSWVPPTERTDGSALTDLAGFKIYYGQSQGTLNHVVTITNPGQTSQVVENLGAGTWYFAVTAYDSDGMESAKSTTASKTIS
jgi:hypothetical protein